MRSGRLDRRVTIEQPAEARTGSGDVTVTWSTLATVWAEKRDVRGNETFLANQRLAEVETVFRIRHRAGLSPKMRVTLAAEAYDILAIVEIGRKRGLDLFCKKAAT